jgi:regulatory protein
MAELRERGVDARAARAAADGVLDSAEEDAYRAAAPRARQLRALDKRTFTSRIAQFLARRGFDWETIARVLARLEGELGRSVQ